ncbi:filament-like plant protein 3 [Olea europaea var. sylvestris]|uniref:filament-like plant protein 3 n=1 Tax=Olea europaea var. sylvestris TaxID=158386 RepID=UPI000C1D025E|nr:filament-like plant protein 3 [Olea europaea var. sylvestris]
MLVKRADFLAAIKNLTKSFEKNCTTALHCLTCLEDFIRPALKVGTNLLHITIKFVIESELKTRNIKKQEVELHVKSLELELEALHSSIGTLEEEIKREKCVSGEAVVRCQTLENEISRMKLDYQLQRSAGIEEFRINQDKELAVAASKFTECQKTIASLSRQLKSLATFDDFLIDSERPV